MKKAKLIARIKDLETQIKMLIEKPESLEARVIKYRYNLTKELAKILWR